VRRVQPLLNLRFKITAAILSSLVACLVFTSAAQTPATTGVDSIRAQELREKLTYIASEKFKGRGNGTPELNLAAEYIAGIFEKNGLNPAGDDGSYYQHFDIYSSRLGTNNDLGIQRAGEPELRFKAGFDFMPALWSVSGNVTGALELL